MSNDKVVLLSLVCVTAWFVTLHAYTTVGVMPFRLIPFCLMPFRLIPFRLIPTKCASVPFRRKLFFVTT